MAKHWRQWPLSTGHLCGTHSAGAGVRVCWGPWIPPPISQPKVKLTAPDPTAVSLESPKKKSLQMTGPSSSIPSGFDFLGRFMWVWLAFLKCRQMSQSTFQLKKTLSSHSHLANPVSLPAGIELPFCGWLDHWQSPFPSLSCWLPPPPLLFRPGLVVLLRALKDSDCLSLSLGSKRVEAFVTTYWIAGGGGSHWPLRKVVTCLRSHS